MNVVRGPTSAPETGTFVMGEGGYLFASILSSAGREDFPSPSWVSIVQVLRSMFVESIGVLLGGRAECSAVLALFLKEVEQNESELACLLPWTLCD